MGDNLSGCWIVGQVEGQSKQPYQMVFEAIDDVRYTAGSCPGSGMAKVMDFVFLISYNCI